MDIYDYIFIGGSLCNLLASTKLKNKKILIIEKDNFLGGAWRINEDFLKNTDLAGHLIVPENNKKGNEIIRFLKDNLDIDLIKIDKNDFFYELDDWRSNGKQGDPLICKYGWTSFNKKIVNYVSNFSNINIKKNTTITNINIINKQITITDKNNNKFYCKKLIIPMYCNLNVIHYEDKNININYESIINIHIIFKIKFCKLNITKNFQGFYSKEPVGVFDRVTVSSINNNTITVSCRLSKNFKKYTKSELNSFFMLFFKEKNLFEENFEILKTYYFNYDCSYRKDSNRTIFFDNIKKINEFYNEKIIFPLNTIYMGHFLSNFINNNLF